VLQLQVSPDATITCSHELLLPLVVFSAEAQNVIWSDVIISVSDTTGPMFNISYMWLTWLTGKLTHFFIHR